MSHKPCHKTKCVAKVTIENETKKLHPTSRDHALDGKVAFCEGKKEYPITRRKCS